MGATSAPRNCLSFHLTPQPDTSFSSCSWGRRYSLQHHSQHEGRSSVRKHTRGTALLQRCWPAFIYRCGHLQSGCASDARAFGQRRSDGMAALVGEPARAAAVECARQTTAGEFQKSLVSPSCFIIISIMQESASVLLKMNVPVHLSGAVAMDNANVIRISRTSLERMDSRKRLHTLQM
jgi:hypothetical protein